MGAEQQALGSVGTVLLFEGGVTTEKLAPGCVGSSSYRQET
ncbi:hypothetical protein [Paenibacillus prosopidis]|nr:hypothetical protein [Paenibacillus prosopidis]